MTSAAFGPPVAATAPRRADRRLREVGSERGGQPDPDQVAKGPKPQGRQREIVAVDAEGREQVAPEARLPGFSKEDDVEIEVGIGRRAGACHQARDRRTPELLVVERRAAGLPKEGEDERAPKHGACPRAPHRGGAGKAVGGNDAARDRSRHDPARDERQRQDPTDQVPGAGPEHAPTSAGKDRRKRRELA